MTHTTVPVRPRVPYKIKSTPLRVNQFLGFKRSDRLYVLKKFGRYNVLGVKTSVHGIMYRIPVVLNPSPLQKRLAKIVDLPRYSLPHTLVDQIISDNVVDRDVIDDLRKHSK